MAVGSVRAKMKCIEKNNGMVKLMAVMDDENKTWAKYTPSGTVQLCIDNPPALDAFEQDQTYFVDFTPAPATEAAENASNG